MSALPALREWLGRYGRAAALALVTLAIVSGGVTFLSRAPLGGQAVEVIFPTATLPQECTYPPSSNTGVNINTASAKELETLPDIGPVMAGRVVQYREAYGPFQCIEDIVDVRGIGPATFQKLKDSITVGP